jgi:hypothetical protein
LTTAPTVQIVDGGATQVLPQQLAAAMQLPLHSLKFVVHG